MATSGGMAGSAVCCFRHGSDDLTLRLGLYDRAPASFELAGPVVFGVFREREGGWGRVIDIL